MSVESASKTTPEIGDPDGGGVYLACRHPMASPCTPRLRTSLNPCPLTRPLNLPKK